MDSITFNISIVDIKRLLDATCIKNKYDTDSGKTQKQFTEQIWRQMMVDYVKSYEETEQWLVLRQQLLATIPLKPQIIIT